MNPGLLGAAIVLPLPDATAASRAGCTATPKGEYVRLGAPAAGWLQTVAVQRGDRVEAGALLFELEDGRQRAAVTQAEAQLARARSELADLKLGKRPEEIARLEANLAEAKATLAYAEQDLERQASLARRDFAAEGAPGPGPRRGRAGQGAHLRHGGRPRHRQAAGARRPDRRRRVRGRDARGEPGPGPLGPGAADRARTDGRHRPGLACATAASGSMPAASSRASCRPARSRCASSCPSPSSAGSMSASRSTCAATVVLPA